MNVRSSLRPVYGYVLANTMGKLVPQACCCKSYPMVKVQLKISSI
ncbi:Uncharacterised protein [Vibrio cholerae]|nr:Uncharacterised protein [Vibrio cholerae]